MSPFIDYSEYGKKLPVRGGVEPRSRRGAFGRSWWGKALIESVEQMAEPGRLARGRNYARSGQVVNYHLEPGAVTAEVQGSQPRPFTAVFTVRPLREDELELIIETIRSAPGMLAEIASGALPTGLGPLLSRLNGIVAETGSVLSHLAILAREARVPTVAGVADDAA